VNRKHWLRVTLLAAAATAALPPVRSSAQSGAAASDVERAEFARLRDTVRDIRAAARERDEAAKRLLQLGHHDVLIEFLGQGNSDLAVPVARALADTENPPPTFLDPLIRLLQPSMSPALADATALAIAGYRDNPMARNRLREFVLTPNVGERQRAPAVRALGTLSDKETAQFLISLLQGQQVGPMLSDAAADALAEMTGLDSMGRDVGLWGDWWQQQVNKSPEQFLADRRSEREGSARQLAAQLRELTRSIIDDVTESHLRIADAALREQNILARLRNARPEYRAAGAQLVNVEQNNGRTVSDAVKHRLHDLIADSSPDVRRRVAGAIAAINDPTASKLLLTQFRRERIPGIRQALLEAIAPTKDVTAVEDLIAALNDNSFQVREAAARALGEVAPEAAKNPVTAARVANALLTTVRDTERRAGASRLRERAVEAMIPLKNPELVRPLSELLTPTEANTPNVRIAAIRALAAMNALPETRSAIASTIGGTSLADREKGVRLEAAKALGAIGGPAQRGHLLGAMNPGTETDPDVRDAAWKSLAGLLPQFEVFDLLGLQERFRGEPERRLAVNLAVLDKRVEPHSLATVQQDTGALYLHTFDKPDEAAAHLKAALDYWDTKGQGQATGLQEDLLRAYLRAKKYDDAMKFAAARIGMNKSNQEAMGRVIVQESDRLTEKKDYAAASQILTEAKQLQIDGKYRDDIDEREKNVRAKILPYLDDLTDLWRAVIA
jgi:HEAT repeat protein